MAKPSFGLIIPQGWQLEFPLELSPTEQFELIIKMSREAERIGYDSIWFFDHLQTSPLIPIVPPLQGKSSVFECWTTISAVAMRTEKVRIGQTVTCALYRNPAHLGKIASVVDVISNGRLELGVGACWNEYEFKSYGYAFPKLKERVERLDETIEIVKKMWTEEVTNFKGKYFTLTENYNYPKPIQKPRPPIMIGGGGESYTLRVVAKQADKWNYGWGIEGYRKKLQVLKKYCGLICRDINEIKLTYTSDIVAAETRKEAEGLFTDWRKQQSKILGKKADVNLGEFRRDNILGSSEEVLEILKKAVRELKVFEFILYMPVATDLKLMKLLHEDIARPLKEYIQTLQ